MVETICDSGLRQVLKYGFNQLEKKGQPGVIYLHPRDFAPDCPSDGYAVISLAISSLPYEALA